jgi:hypothetical protein
LTRTAHYGPSHVMSCQNYRHRSLITGLSTFFTTEEHRVHRDFFSLCILPFVEYKVQRAGISIVYVYPTYSSQVCSRCGVLGTRHKHTFACSSCRGYQHSDRNAAINLLRLGGVCYLANGTCQRANCSGRKASYKLLPLGRSS